VSSTLSTESIGASSFFYGTSVLEMKFENGFWRTTEEDGPTAGFKARQRYACLTQSFLTPWVF
jgi:hypothetical protein